MIHGVRVIQMKSKMNGHDRRLNGHAKKKHVLKKGVEGISIELCDELLVELSGVCRDPLKDGATEGFYYTCVIAMSDTGRDSLRIMFSAVVLYQHLFI